MRGPLPPHLYPYNRLGNFGVYQLARLKSAVLSVNFLLSRLSITFDFTFLYSSILTRGCLCWSRWKTTQWNIHREAAWPNNPRKETVWRDSLYFHDVFLVVALVCVSWISAETQCSHVVTDISLWPRKHWWW